VISYPFEYIALILSYNRRHTQAYTNEEMAKYLKLLDKKTPERANSSRAINSIPKVCTFCQGSLLNQNLYDDDKSFMDLSADIRSSTYREPKINPGISEFTIESLMRMNDQ